MFFNEFLNGDRIYRVVAMHKVSYASDMQFNESLIELNNYTKHQYYGITKKNRCTDRIVYDFDTDSKELKALKDRIVSTLQPQELVQEYQATVLESKELYHTYCEVQEFVDSNDFKPLVCFSGSKGFHVYYFVHDVYLSNINKIMTMWTNNLKTRYSTIDDAVSKNPLNGMIRLPGAVHPISGLRCQVIDMNTDYDAMISNLEGNNPTFKFSDWCNDDLRRKLIELDGKFVPNVVKHVSNGWNCIEVFEFFYPDIKASVHTKNYNKYVCPFHDDRDPSLVIYPDHFKCFGCGVGGNWFDLIKKVVGTDDGTVRHTIGSLRRSLGMSLREAPY